MARINLLPWRETERKERQQEFYIMLGIGVAIAALIVLGVHFQISNMIDHQERRNRYLTNEIKILDDKIKEIQKLDSTRQKLLERMEVIQNLQTTRPGVVHLFDELINTLPEGVHLVALDQKDKAITLSGRAESNARVSSLMRNIEESEWIGSATLDVIETKEGDNVRVSEFKLQTSQTSPDEKSEEEEG